MELVLVAAVLGTLGVVGLLGGISVLGASVAHRAKVRQFLTAPLSIDPTIQAKAKGLGIDGAAAIGVSTFDVLYNTMKMNGGVNPSQLVRPEDAHSRLLADPRGDP